MSPSFPQQPRASEQPKSFTRNVSTGSAPDKEALLRQQKKKEPPYVEIDGLMVDRQIIPKYLEHLKTAADFVQENLDYFTFFLEHSQKIPTFIYTNHSAFDPKRTIVFVDVTEIAQARESGKFTEAQIKFNSFHEFGHYKEFAELARVDRYHALAQYDYEDKKRVRDPNDPTQFLSLAPTYHQFYNIIDDMIVNFRALNTAYYATDPSRKEEAESLYGNHLFAAYRQVKPGEKGSFKLNPDPEKAEKEPILFVGEGNGDLVKVSQEEYRQNVDWTKLEPKMGRNGQFLDFLMKDQMGRVDSDRVADPELGKDGDYQLHPDVAQIFTRPLLEVYTDLLDKAIQVLASHPPEKTKVYLEFMKGIIKVPTYQLEGKKVKIVGAELVENVINPNAIDVVSGKINVAYAKIQFLNKIKSFTAELGIDNPRQLKLIDAFRDFKKFKARGAYSLSLPLKHILVERNRIVRNLIEPIFSLLCILDDSFYITLPPENAPDAPPMHRHSENEPPKNHDWQVGDKVVNDDSSSPHKGKKGVITDVTFGPDGNILSVKVEYYEEK